MGRAMEHDHVMDARARDACEAWLDPGLQVSDAWEVLAAKDSRLELVRAEARDSGLDLSHDANVSSTRTGFAALCLTRPSGDPHARQLSYQLPDGQGGLLGQWRDP